MNKKKNGKSLGNHLRQDFEDRMKASTEFLRLCVAGRIDEAYLKYVDMEGKHHNPFFPAGFPALKQAMKENHSKYPNNEIRIGHVLADSELVAVHSLMTRKGAGDMIAVVHLFRFKGGKIVELWDIGQALPKDSPNKDGVT